MEDLQQINDIVNESVKTTSYWSVIISSIVFICYTLIIKIIEYFKSKDKDKPMIEMANAVKEVSNNVVKLNTILDKIIQDNSKKDFTKCKNSIELSFICLRYVLIEFGQSIIVNNNIEANKDFVVSSISQKVNTEYYKIYAILGTYEINDVPVNTHLKPEWIDELTKEIIDIIYNNQNKESRIRQLTRKVELTVNSYSTLITNKTFN